MAQAFSRQLSRSRLLLLAVLVVALYVLVPQFGDFRSSWHLLRHPAPSETLAAVGFTALTYGAAAATYCFLAFHSLSYARTLVVQLAAMFINRLVPAGVGALGVNFAYLRQNKHTAAQAATMVGINNLLGFLGNSLLLGLALLFQGQQSFKTAGPMPLQATLIIAAVIVAALLIAWVVAGQRFRKLIKDIRRQLLSYRRRPRRLVAALLSSMVLTLGNALALYCCVQALGIELGFTPVLLTLTLGVGAGAATPTPGGLGGFEAGLVAGLVAYNVPAPTALAIALLYRFISYWLALVVGALAFVFCQRRHLLGF